MIRDYRKPLIVIAPKILLRHPAAISPLSDFELRTSFKTIIGMLYFIFVSHTCKTFCLLSCLSRCLHSNIILH